MNFMVSHKGITQYCGRLEYVLKFVEKHWGSSEKAYAIGVKVIAVM